MSNPHRRHLVALVALSLLVFAGCVAGGSSSPFLPLPEDAAPSGDTALPADGGLDSHVPTDSGAHLDTGGTPGDTGTSGPVDTGAIPKDATVVDAAPTTFFVGGTLSGLASGDTVVLADNGSDDLVVAANGPFVFTTPVPAGSTYVVTVITQPGLPSETCTVTQGTGMAVATVASIVVSCVSDSFAVGGTVSGLAPGDSVVLEDNGGDNHAVAANGSFSFPTTVASGAPYAVTVLTQPMSPLQTCVVSGGSGTIASAAVTSVAVTCTTDTFSVGGTLSGLTQGNSIVLEDNGGDAVPVTANGSFMFPTQVPSGHAYMVSVSTQPSGQTCSVSAGAGTVGAANVSSVVVNCGIATYTVGGTVLGLAPGDTVGLQANGESLSIGSNGSFAFATPLPVGTSYAVTVSASPSSPAAETCVVANGTGIIASSNVSTVTVTCTVLTFSVGGTVTGLGAGDSVTLQNNGGDDVTITSNQPFTFATSVASTSPYDVTVLTNPASPLEFCSVVGGTGSITNQAVTNVAVTCYPPPFPSTGANGAFSPTVSIVLPSGVYNYTTINIPKGVAVTASGTGTLDLRATGTVLIAGTINLSGSGGGAPQPCGSFPGGAGGGATGDPLYSPTFGNGTAGPGGPEGTGAPGSSGMEEPDASLVIGGGGGDFGGGGGGTVKTDGSGGGGGGGYAGGGGGSGGSFLGGPGAGTEGGAAGAAFWSGGAGGQFSGGGVYNGSSGQNGQLGNGGSNGGSTETGAGGGGGGISSAAASDLAVASTFIPGSGGGGGSGNYLSPGGGGGGGGGALRIAGPTIIVAATGQLLATGGAGSPGLPQCGGTGPGGGGGGGSGGVIFLDGAIVSVAAGATVSAAGGAGAASPGGGLAGGGSGGLGRIRLSLTPGPSVLSGTFNPPLQGGAGAANTPGFAYVAAFPN